MKRVNLFLIVVLFLGNFVSAQNVKPHYQKCIQSVIDSVKTGKKEAIAAMISYPLKREYPLPDVVDKSDFIKRYDEIFDTTLKNEIAKSNPAKDWSDMGWRGMMLKQGIVWMDFDGHVTSINYQSQTEIDLKKKLIAAQKKELDSSIAFFHKPICVLETDKFRIRIDNLGNENYRYVSWPIEKAMSEKPDLIIYRGNLVVEGSGGNHQYEFKKENYIYECAFIVAGEKNSPPAKLTIYQGDKVILSQNARIIAK